VAGLARAKEALQQAVILPIKFPNLFTGMYDNLRDDYMMIIITYLQ
jgi:hypothetical protein